MWLCARALRLVGAAIDCVLSMIEWVFPAFEGSHVDRDFTMKMVRLYSLSRRMEGTDAESHARRCREKGLEE